MPSKVIIPETFLLGKLKTVDRIRIFQISVVCHSENTAISGKVLPAFPVHAVFFLPLNPYCCWQGTEELNDDIKHLKINKLTLVTEVLSLACQYKSNHELAGFKHVPDIQGWPSPTVTAARSVVTQLCLFANIWYIKVEINIKLDVKTWKQNITPKK